MRILIVLPLKPLKLLNPLFMNGFSKLNAGRQNIGHLVAAHHPGTGGLT
jgi:hypothetical protein